MTSQEQAQYGELSKPPDDPADRDIVLVAAEESHVVELDDDHDVPPADARHDDGDIGREWHDIQAMFVDDPRGSVQLAAAAADAAVDALVATLHQRQSALTPRAEAEHESGETEQLREALRSYRIFCQHLADLGQRLTEPAAMAR